MKLLDNLKWRYATKLFDASKKVSDKNIDLLKETVQLSASSYGLQPYKVFIVKNEETREALKPHSWGQDQITSASHLFVFCNYTAVTEKDVKGYLELKSDAQNIELEALQGYHDFMASKMAEMKPEDQDNWAAKQVYIALGNLLAGAAELEIDTCPMEGFEKDKYNEILGLSEKGLNATVVAAIGYRAKEDQNLSKVRKPISAIFEEI